jgi:2-polyprenyl-6-methoxyphenol hydroxylase-like FAD-dependent oxidoreductase
MFGFTIVAIQRAELHRILSASFGGRVHLGKRLVTIECPRSEPKAQFTDGSHAKASFLIGADGVHSATRIALFGKPPVRRTGQTCWRGLANFDLPAQFQRSTTEIWGRNSRMGVADVGHGKVYWFLVDSSCGQRPTKDRAGVPELLQIVNGYAEIAGRIIEATPHSAINEVELEDLRPELPWYQGKVCLIGDAAHPMTPNMGQGGAQAVEDAHCLAQILSGRQDVLAAFETFQSRRFKKVRSIGNASFQMGRMIHSRWTRFRNLLFRAVPARMGNGMMRRIYRIES